MMPLEPASLQSHVFKHPAGKHTGSNIDDRLPRCLSVLLGAAIALILATEWIAMPLRYFVNDDYQMIYTTWLRSLGQIPGTDFSIQSFHLLPEMLRPILSLSGEDPDRLWMFRMPFFLCLATLPLLVWYITGRIIGRSAAPFAALASLLNWGMLERGLDIRPDLVLAVLVLLQLAIAVRANFRSRDALIVGILSAFMLALRLKSVLFLPVILGWLIVRGDNDLEHAPHRHAKMTRSVLFAAGALIGALITVGTIHLLGLLPAFIDGNRSLAHLARQHMTDSSIRIETMSLLWTRDTIWLGLFSVGLFAWRKLWIRTGINWYLTSLLITGLVYVALNPAFYAYSLVILLPLMSPFIGLACVELLRLGKRVKVQTAVMLALLTAWFGSHVPLLVYLATRPTNADQLQLARAFRTTAPTTQIFSLEGIGLFRPSIRDWRLSAVALEHYRQGEIDLVGQLQSSRPEIIVKSYRIPDWLRPQDRRWLVQHYIDVSPQLAVLGATLNADETAQFVISRDSLFEVIEGALRIDDTWHAQGDTVALPAGVHSLRSGNIKSTLRFAWPAGIALRPSGLPYLIPPQVSLYDP